MKSNKILFLLTSLSLTACSSPESTQTKMGRYKTHQENKYQNSEFVIVGDLTYGTTSRAIASVTSEKDSNNADKAIEFTNKKLYFLGLLDQYEYLRSYSNDSNAPKLSICPSFHTGLISYYEKNNENHKKRTNTKEYAYESLKDGEFLNKNPELYLSLSTTEKYPNVLTYISENKISKPEKIKEIVDGAINTHLQKTYYELRELCEYGQSDNYYIYENMISYFKTHETKQNSATLNTLLKSTLFSNLAIINSLTTKEKGASRTIASEKDLNGIYYNEQIMNKFNAEWTKKYFNSL